MAITPKIRFDILRRDNFTCQYCGAKAVHDGVVLEVDHKTPRSKGGSDLRHNLVTACWECNQGKRDGEAWEPNYTHDVESFADGYRAVLRNALEFLVEEMFGVEDVKAEGERNHARLLDYPRENVRLAVQWVKSGAFDRNHILPYAPPSTVYGKVMTVLSFVGHDPTDKVRARLSEKKMTEVEG